MWTCLNKHDNSDMFSTCATCKVMRGMVETKVETPAILMKENVEIVKKEIEPTKPSEPDEDVNISPQLSELSATPVDIKKAELEAYKHYANQILPSLESVIQGHRSNGKVDVESVLNDFEARILYYQKQVFMCRTYESTIRLRRATFIQENNASETANKRKTDLEYKPFVPGSGEVVKRKTKSVVKKGLSQKERLIADLVSKGLTREQAEKMLG